MSDETMVRFYTKEEEFLDEFGYSGFASAVCRVIGDDVWRPDYQANDDTRRQTKYALEQGYFPDNLFFDGAAVYHRDRMFSSAQVILKSSRRVVTVRVSKTDDDQLTTEKIVDKPI